VQDDLVFRDFVNLRSRGLLKTAWLLTGDWASAEDLVQTALIKAWARWGQIRSYDAALDAYVRKVILRTYLSSRRRHWCRESPTDDLPEVPAPQDHDITQRLALMAALGELPKVQRAILVLRYYSDLTEGQVAEVMGCSIGAVKSQSSKAMAKLRRSHHLTNTIDTEVS
jgi:RNA polymerase sigma-70 factor (sigma-E family)